MGKPQAPATAGLIPEPGYAGTADASEFPTVEQRTPEGAPLSTGPRVGEKKEYQPASYKTSRGNVRTDR